MKIAFLTEGEWRGKPNRTHTNLRTDLAWMAALDAEHFQLYDRPFGFDLVMIIVPKKCEDGNFDIAIWMEHFEEHIRPNNSKIAFVQEGPHWYWQDYRVHTQILLLQFISNVDMIFCHNEHDVKYYKGLLPGKPVVTLPALMIDKTIPKDITHQENRTGAILGGNWVSWYSGQDSYFIAQEFGEKIYAPSMGRKQEYEDYLEDIEYYPYLNWSRWMAELSKRKYAVHLMRTFAAGTFALNCAALGIPCIGYRHLDTQKTCFPELSVELGDLETARKKARQLRENKEFYLHLSEYAKKAYYDNFREDIFIEKFQTNIKELK